MPEQVTYYPMRGGEDRVSTDLEVAPGKLLASQNYEVGPYGQGYDLIEGYERWDGLIVPSEANYARQVFDAGQNEPTLPATIKGSISNAVAYIYKMEVTGGTWSGNDARGTFWIIPIQPGDNSDGFLDEENLADYTSGTVYAQANGVTDFSRLSGQAHNDELAAAVAAARSAILPVPGEGRILGVHLYQGQVYAFRYHKGIQFNNGKAYSYVVLVGTGNPDRPFGQRLHASDIAAPLARILLRDLKREATLGPVAQLKPKKSSR